jgi:hypothetical protein
LACPLPSGFALHAICAHDSGVWYQTSKENKEMEGTLN